MDFWIFLLSYIIVSFFANFFQVFTEPGKVESGSCKAVWYILVHNVDDFR